MSIDLHDYLREQALNPEWRSATKVHDWRNYATEEIRRLWPTFTIEQRLALVEMFDRSASDERWY